MNGRVWRLSLDWLDGVVKSLFSLIFLIAFPLLLHSLPCEIFKLAHLSLFFFPFFLTLDSSLARSMKRIKGVCIIKLEKEYIY